MFGRIALALTCSLALGACAPPGLSPEDRARASRAVEYLATTDHEMGVDVVMILRSFGELADDRRAVEVAAARGTTLRPSELARYGVLLAMDTPPLAPSTLAAVPIPTDTPDPADTLDDDRVQTCVEAMMTCEVPAECVDYAYLDAWGYVLTHQAAWLLFAHWFGCEVRVDVEALRHRYAARIVAEARFDPRPSDLFFERLGVLGHLGFGGEIEPAWVDILRASQAPAGCFPVNDEVRCHPHPTALALWTVVHASRAGVR